MIGVVEELSFFSDGLGDITRVREPCHVNFGDASLCGRGDKPCGIPATRKVIKETNNNNVSW